MSWITFLAQNALRGTVVLTAAFAAAAALRRASAARRSLVWVSACAALLVLPMALLVVPKWSPLPAEPYVGPSFGPAMAPSAAISRASALPVGPLTPASVPFAFRPVWLAYLWMLGCASAAVWFLWCFSRAAGVVRSALPAGYARAALEEVRLALGIRRAARALESSDASMPLAWGVMRPTVILPSGAREWPEGRLRAVLLHELAHARRFDLPAQAVAQAACCLYWFHPLVWFAALQFYKDRERACDDAALSHVAAPDYAGHLLEVARGMALRRARWAVVPAMAQPSDLEARVRALLDGNRDRRPLTRRAAFAAIAIACAVLLPAAALTARAQPARAEAGAVAALPAVEPTPEPAAAVSAPEVSAEPEPAATPEPQTASGLLWGVVRDPSGALVPQCGVSVWNLDLGSGGTNMQTAVTNQGGEYRLALPPGRWAIEVHAAGLIGRRKDVEVAAGLSTMADINLEIGHVTEQVNVTAKRSGAAAPAAAPQPSVGGKVQPLSLIRKVQPVYPEPLRLAGIEGTVVIRAIISKEGEVLDPHAVNADVHPVLIAVAIDAVRQWKYRPTLLNGEPVETSTEIDITFSLQ